MTFELLGHVPSKKNQWRPKPGGGITTFAKTGVKDAIDYLRSQAVFIWKLKLKRGPVEHPEMTVTFYVKTRAGDRDNKLSTILDVLRDAGVLVNDNIARFNGTLTLLPAVVAKEERTVIQIL